MTAVEVMVCVNRRFGDKPSCAGRGAVALAAALEAALRARGLDVLITRSVCQNACERGPNLRILPGPVVHNAVSPADIPALVEAIATIAPSFDLPPPI